MRDIPIEPATGETLSDFLLRSSDDVASDASVQSRTWILPSRVELRGEGDDREVVAVYDAAQHKQVGEREMRGMLESFAGLADASDERIRSFVRARGALIVSDAGVPPAVRFLGSPVRVRWYRAYARLLAATLRTASRAQHGQGIHDDDAPIFAEHIKQWVRPVAGRTGEPAEVYLAFPGLILNRHGPVELAREIVTAIANWWLTVGRVRPVVWWEGSAAQIGWSGGPWGALGAQLATTIMRQLGKIVCAYCGKRIPETGRRRKANQPPCCGRAECKREAARLRKQRQRERKSEASPSRSSGTKTAHVPKSRTVRRPKSVSLKRKAVGADPSYVIQPRRNK